jgi:hypothetical protein
MDDGDEEWRGRIGGMDGILVGGMADGMAGDGDYGAEPHRALPDGEWQRVCMGQGSARRWLAAVRCDMDERWAGNARVRHVQRAEVRR